MTAECEKLIRLQRMRDGKRRAFIGGRELFFISVHEEYSRNGHDVTIRIPAGHFEFVEEQK